MSMNTALHGSRDTWRCGQRQHSPWSFTPSSPDRASVILQKDVKQFARAATLPPAHAKLFAWRIGQPLQRATWAQSSSKDRPTVTVTPPRFSSTFKVRLIQPVNVPCPEECDKLLVYLPGTDGTGQAILPQIPALRDCGYDVWCLYLPPEDRSDWEQLTTQVTLLLRQLLQHWRGGHPPPAMAAAARAATATTTSSSSTSSTSHGGGSPAAAPRPRITIVAESFGCCLALRLAASGAGPELLDRMVLVNPATSFNRSLSGLSSLIAGTNLLSLFPRDWYSVAQATLLPLLVAPGRVEPSNQRLLQSMILMEPPASSQSFGFGAPPQSAAAAAAAAAAANPSGDIDDDDDDPSSSTSGSSGGSSSKSGGSTLYYGPAAAANFRANLLREGDPGEAVLGRVTMPVLLITSARDRLLPSILEGARLERALPTARRIILPDSGHAAMLECGFNLPAVVRAAGFLGSTVPGDPRVAGSEREPGSGRDVDGVAAAAAGTAVAPQEASAALAGSAVPGALQLAQKRAAEGASSGAGGLVGGAAGGAARGAGTGDWSGWSQQAEGGMDWSTASVSVGKVEGSGLGPLVAASRAPRVRGRRGEGEEETTGGAPSDGGEGGVTQVAARRRAAAAVGGGGTEGSLYGRGSEEELHRADIDSAFDEWCQNLAVWRDVVSPVVLGFEHLPPPGSPGFSRPMLFVGNHQKMGFYDTPLLVYELYVRGYRVRGLAHPGHWAGPMGRWFESFGSVKASPMAAFRLLRSAEKVLLFPGGAKEVVKKRGQEYTLLWKDSPDFVRLAARCNALIVPFAAVGADDAYEVIMDTDEVIAHPVLGPLTTGLLSRVSSALRPEESIFPITKLPVVGLPTPIPVPNLQRLYFQFAPPVDPRGSGVDINDPQQVQELYDGIKDTVTQCMSGLLAVREADEESQLGARLAKSLQRMVPVLGAAAPPGAQAPAAPTVLPSSPPPRLS